MKITLKSNRIAKAIFKGMLKDFNIDKPGSTLKEYELKGKLDLHGKSKRLIQRHYLEEVDIIKSLQISL
jgi:hypothetical protein